MKKLLLLPTLLLVACAHIPPNFDVHKDLVYNTSPETLQGDLYLPKKAQMAPLVVTIHGGGWTGRTRADMNDVATELASQGFAVFNISYRLAPKHRFPAQIKDIRAALRYLEQHKTEYRYDINKVALFGYSAGAHLAALVGMADDLEVGKADTVKIKAVVAGGTPADLTKYENSESVVKFMGGTYKQMPDAYKKASPIFYVNKGDPPIFLYHGTNDWVVEYQQMLDFKRRLEEEGVGVETFTIPILGHIAIFLYSDTSVDKSIVFLKEQLK